MTFWEAGGLAWLAVVRDLSDLYVKVLNANLFLTCIEVQHHTHTGVHSKGEDWEVS